MSQSSAGVGASSVSGQPVTPSPPAQLTLLLHHAAFRDDPRELERLISLGLYDINSVDALGNTALHLAITMRHDECTRLLLSSGASTSVKNRLGWSPLHEAVSMGDRHVLRRVWQASKTQASATQELAGLLTHLQSLPDFRATFAWKLTSWLPFIGRLLPADSLVLSKRGGQIRVDCSMLEMKGMKWIYHPYSFLLTPRCDPPAAAAAADAHIAAASSVGAAAPSAEHLASQQNPREPYLVFTLDHETKLWQCVNQDEGGERENEQQQHSRSNSHSRRGSGAHEAAPSASASASAAAPAPVRDVDLEYELDDFLQGPLMSAFSPGRVRFTEVATRSWRSWSSWTSMVGLGKAPHRKEAVGKWEAHVWDVDDIRLHFLSRYEHLSEEERAEIQASQSSFRALWSNPAKLRRELAEKAREEEEEALSEEEKKKRAAEDAAAIEHRPSIPPPAPADVSFAQYFHAGNQRAYSASAMEALYDAQRDASVAGAAAGSKDASGGAVVEEEELSLHEDEEGDDADNDDDDDETTHGQARSANHDENAGDREEDDEELEPPSAAAVAASAASSSAPAAAASPVAAPAPLSGTAASLHLGRPILQSERRKKFKARVWMGSGFPMSTATVVHVVALLLGQKYPQLVAKLQHFVSQELPPGFPVKLVVPLLPVLSFDVSIKSFDVGEQVRYSRLTFAGAPIADDADCAPLDAEAEERAVAAYFAIPSHYQREELSEEEQHKQQQKYRKRWKAAQAKKKADAEA